MLTPQQYELAKQLDINVSQLVKSHFLGNYKSAFKGQGITFADMRPYIEGDPEKNIDRITTAKKGELYVKEYEEERQLKLFFLIDTAPSMYFHTTEKTKIQIAHDGALSIAYAGYKNGDQIGWANYTNTINTYIPTSKKKINLYKLSRIFSQSSHDYQKAPLLMSDSEWLREGLGWGQSTLQTLINYRLRHHLIIIFSDDFIGHPHTELTKLAQHNEILYINIFDPFEKKLSIHESSENSEIRDNGTPAIKILQNNKMQEISLTKEMKQQYIQKFKQKQKNTERTIRSLWWDYLAITTHEDPIKKLMELFHKRSIGR